MRNYKEHKEELAKQREWVKAQQRQTNDYISKCEYLVKKIEETKLVIENLKEEINSNPQEVVLKNRKNLSENLLNSYEKKLKRLIKFPLSDI